MGGRLEEMSRDARLTKNLKQISRYGFLDRGPRLRTTLLGGLAALQSANHGLRRSGFRSPR
jgi:hypothetical protein